MDNHAKGQVVLLNYMVNSGNYIVKNHKDKESKRESKRKKIEVPMHTRELGKLCSSVWH